MTATATSASEQESEATPAPREPREQTAAVPVPRPLLWTCLGVVLVAVPMTFLGAWRIGVTTDEYYHVQRLQNLFTHGWYLIDADLVHGRPAPGLFNMYVYAPVTTLLLHGWNMLWGVEGRGQVAVTPEAYAFRHLAVALIGLLGVLAVAGTARLLLRSWRWGVVAAAILLAIPLWPGQSMFNVKDVPVGTGYSLVTLGLTLMLVRQRRLGERLGATLLLTTGTVLTVGTRPGMWTAVALSCGAFGVMTLASTSIPRRGRFLRVGQAAAAVGVAAGILVAVYPAAFGHPWRLLLGSALSSSDFGGVPGAWWYVPFFVAVEVPSLLLLVLLITWLEAAATVRTALLRSWSPQVMAFALVVVQAAALPALAVVRQSHLYNGLRQLLFACPAVALIVTGGIYLALAHSSQERAGRRGRVVLVALTSVALIAPTAAQLRLFPYNYAYASPAFDLGGLPAVNDYWRASLRELEPQIPRGEFLVCRALTADDGITMRRADQGVAPAELSQDCRTHPDNSLGPYRTDVVGDYSVEPTFLAVFTEIVQVGSNCHELAAVTRSPYGRTDTVSAVARCRLVLSPYPAGGIRITSTETGMDFLLGGWTPAPRQPGVVMDAPGASLGFQLPKRLAGRALALKLQARVAPGVELRVNNEPVPYVREGSRQIRVAVSARRAASFGQRRLVLTFLDPDRARAAVTLRSLQVHGANR